ncbi:unnamed protein product [Trichogramma brassicae]|uniref:Uncharacterized protein n=1 Tax=Trichogramma brassicae TaxID=86971 RepID=A0A6H5J4F5_9HYME|nr:unnamed protein product [Trichogramma brassicae]
MKSFQVSHFVFTCYDMCSRSSTATCHCRIHNVQLQPAREEVSLQHGAVQAVGSRVRRRVLAVQALHGRQALPLLQGGLLPRPGQAHHSSQGVQTFREILLYTLIGGELRIPPIDVIIDSEHPALPSDSCLYATYTRACESNISARRECMPSADTRITSYEN